jgi:hypothetical protein
VTLNPPDIIDVNYAAPPLTGDHVLVDLLDASSAGPPAH